jgi:beta-glucosidase
VAAADRGGVQPQFPFGAGLSYTTFEYSGLTSSAGSDGQAGATDVSVTVRNTGSRAGMEVVQVYVTPSHDTLSPPVKRLKRFAKILLNPGESRQLRFRIGEGEETRPFTVRVGSLTREVQ